jgi:hypothetical protein
MTSSRAAKFTHWDLGARVALIRASWEWHPERVSPFSTAMLFAGAKGIYQRVCARPGSPLGELSRFIQNDDSSCQ